MSPNPRSLGCVIRRKPGVPTLHNQAKPASQRQFQFRFDLVFPPIKAIDERTIDKNVTDREMPVRFQMHGHMVCHCGSNQSEPTRPPIPRRGSCFNGLGLKNETHCDCAFHDHEPDQTLIVTRTSGSRPSHPAHTQAEKAGQWPGSSSQRAPHGDSSTLTAWLIPTRTVRLVIWHLKDPF